MKENTPILFEKDPEGGYIALISVVIISSLLMLAVSSFNLASLNEANIGLQEMKSKESFYLAQACAEEGLMNLKDDLGYSGDEVLSFEEGSCQIFPLEGAGNNDRVLKVSGSVGDITRRLRIVISQVNPETQVASWEEVESF